MYRGPPSGTRGKVILLFEDNPISKVGVRFDKPIPDGVDLGGICEGTNGFFCNGTLCKLNSVNGFCLLFLLFFLFLLFCILNFCLTPLFTPSFCLVADLRLENTGVEELDNLLINTLFEVALYI